MFLQPSSVSGWSRFRSVLGESAAPNAIVVGVPSDLGGGIRKGAAEGPDRIRTLSQSMKSISRKGYDLSDLKVFDAGDLITRGLDLENTITRLFEVYGELFQQVNCPIVTLGGDHSITFPIVNAARLGGRIGLVWFDAHPDVLDVCHGSRLSHGSPLRRIVECGVHPTDVLVVGTRAYDPSEPEFIAQNRISELRAAEFCEDYSNAFVQFASEIEQLCQRVDKLYVSIDIDVLDDCHAPGTGTPVSGGLSSSVLLRLLSSIPGCVIGYDIVEFAPPLDSQGSTARVVNEIVLEVFARIKANAV